MITDGKFSSKQQQQRPPQMGKQNNVRKMSTMPEEDGSDDSEPDPQPHREIRNPEIRTHQNSEIRSHQNPEIRHQNPEIRSHQNPEFRAHQNAEFRGQNPEIRVYQNPEIRSHQDQEFRSHDPDSDSLEEHQRLLTPGKKLIVSGVASSGNGVKRSSSGNSSTDSVHVSRGQQSGRLEVGSREISMVQSGRFSRGMELYGARHHRFPSMRSLKSNATDDPQHVHGQHHQQPPAASWASIVFDGGHYGRPFPDSVSIRSLASIGMGSSDGRKLTIRRVPTSPSELLNMVHPPTPVEDDLSTCSTYDDGDAADPEDYRQPKRPHWENKVQFVLACIGYSVGLGNVWRFPYLCYKSGGGVFLVPYFLILIVCGVPLLYMELAIGQFTRRGPIGALGQLCPLLKGAGLSSVVISFLMSTYHNVIIAYAIYYFFAAFKTDQPWSDCDNLWNTANCWSATFNYDNRSAPPMSKTPSEEFFDNKVLQISEGIEHPGIVRWELAACLITAWVMVYFSIWKSIKSSARVRYLTATLPFFLIIVVLFRAITLEGAEKGLQFFFKVEWHRLKDAKVWVHAAAQIFNSVGVGFGSMICFASYNKFHNNIFIDTLAVSLIDAFTSLLVGIFTFATIGNIAFEQNTSVQAVLTDGPGLVFVVYPEALAKMPASQIWAVLFFFMLVCLSLNSQFAIVEVVVTSIQDGFPNYVKRHLLSHEMLVLLICVVSFLLGLPNITQGGIYFFQLIDHYAASISIMFLIFFEVIAVSWFYGVDRLSNNIKEMFGRVPSIYFRFCWLIASPLLIMAVWVFSLIDYEPPTYHKGEYQYPWWAEAVGWGIASLSLICIPAFAIYVLIRAEGKSFSEKLKSSVKPHFEACAICGQEYCSEPLHSFEEELLKEPIQEMNSLIQTNYTTKPQNQ